MAERRMFAKTIVDSDAFLDMPLSTQALYFHLSMRADDDGFINNPKKIQRTIGASEDDLKLLLAKSFILAFETGVIVIKHWRINNYIQKDRYKETLYQDEMSALEVKDNGSYTFNGHKMDTQCIQDGYNGYTGKDRLGKNSIGYLKESCITTTKEKEVVDTTLSSSRRFVKPTMDEIKDYISKQGYRKLNAEEFYDYYEVNGWYCGKHKMKDFKAAIRTWARKRNDIPTSEVNTLNDNNRGFEELE